MRVYSFFLPKLKVERRGKERRYFGQFAKNADIAKPNLEGR